MYFKEMLFTAPQQAFLKIIPNKRSTKTVQKMQSNK
jgi:hypothetical protein